MGAKSFFSKPLATLINATQLNPRRRDPLKFQEKVFRELIRKGKETAFGRNHNFDLISSYADFKKNVPIQDYENMRPYMERIISGEKDVLWPGLPIYLCKTSGTTSGVKYIPLTRESMPNHINAARNALLSYIAETGNADYVDGKMIFLQGSPVLDYSGKIPVGRLSGITAHHVPAYLQKNRMPSYETNCIEDWDKKVDRIAEETLHEDMRLISGIPSWVQMYFERLKEKSGEKTIKEIFPNFNLFVFGGVNYEPYRSRFEELIGGTVPGIELFPASEGFIAFQDSQTEPGLLLNVGDGIFYEFIPVEEFFNENPTRLSLEEVETEKQYALILNTNAGLWGYSIGDTVKFVSKFPHRLVVTGRIKHFTSAFGEHVIAEEVESSLLAAIEKLPAEVIEFTVAPQITPEDGLPYHEWLISFAREPENMELFASIIDQEMQNKNPYYKDLIVGKVLRPLKITPLDHNAFNNYMRSQGKLGGQYKVPRLSNDRKIADLLYQWKK